MLLRTLALPMGAISCLIGAANAQATGGRGPRVAVTVAVVDRLPQPNAPYVLMRNPAPVGDVILISATADAAVLSDTISLLVTARQAAGDTASTSGTFRARPNPPGRATRRGIPWAVRVLADLRRAPGRMVAGVGRVPAVTIWLPAQPRRSGATPRRAG